MKRTLEYAKCALFVIFAPLGFVFVWSLFASAVNPPLAVLMIEGHAKQSALHLYTVDAISFTWNYPLRLWWGVLAFLFFAWSLKKKDGRRRARRIGIAIFLAPYLALAVLSVAAALVQERAQPATAQSP